MTDAAAGAGSVIVDTGGAEFAKTRELLASVNRCLTKKGYVISDINGRSRRKPIEDAYVLGEEIPVFGILKEKARAGLLPALKSMGQPGNIADLYVTTGPKWYMYVYRKEYVDKMRVLADSLAAKYHVDIAVSARSLLYE